MSVDGIIPNLTASAAVSPYRFVKVSGVMTGAHCAAETEFAVGVSDSSINAFNGTYNAAVGDPIQLQQGLFMQVETADQVITGELIAASNDGTGRAISESTSEGPVGTQWNMVALQSAGAAGEIVWAFWRPTVIPIVSVDDTTIFGDGSIVSPLTTD